MSIAVIRNMDTQGRIIIPADIRKETGIRSGSTLEIATDGTTIRIRKCTPRNTGSKELRDFLEPLYKNIRAGLPSAALTASWHPKAVICQKAHRSQRNCALLSRRAEKCFLKRASARQFPTAPGRLPHCFRSL